MNILSGSFQRLSTLRMWFIAQSMLVKVAIIIVVAVIVGSGSWLMLRPKVAEVSYQTTIAEKGTLVVSVTSTGQVSSSNTASVTTTTTGVVKKVFVQNGQEVSAGQKLAELDLDQAAQQKYTQARASYQSAKNSLSAAESTQLTLQSEMFAKWQSYKTLSESDQYKDTSSANRGVAEFHISQNDWLAAEAKYKTQADVILQARMALSSAWQSLQQSSPTITAPVAGTVSGFSLQPGAIVTSSASSNDTTTTGEKIATIHANAVPQVSVNLTEVDVVSVQVGNKATVSFDALPDKTYTGKVISIDSAGSVSSGVTSYPTVIQLDEKVEAILPNMSASANIMTKVKNDVLIVPSSAIQTQDGQSTVRVMKNGSPQTQSVEVGISSGTQTEVLSGVNEGDEVVTRSISSSTTKSNAGTTSPFSVMSGNRGFAGGGATVRIER